ncbi:citryl-CoA lyase [Arthrobacter sp. StoSoilB13]|uniref:citryl-CoA lyase n=1 Tax=Arthrobacter sp. StoSoilB13 TaxID=2830993 RepID=UPI001CC778E0|nr:citryl-CoA lyase [Arthrobacter sp. StoSoilB13]
MTTRDTNAWETDIGEVEKDDVIIRGHRLSQLIGNTSYSEMMYLVLTGKRATPGQARVLDALLVSVMEHGISPSSTITRMLASYGVPIQVGIAAGVTTFGDIQGGAGQQLALKLQSVVHRIAEDGEVTDESLQRAAKEIVADSRARREPLEGFGHPQHGADPRFPILMGIAKEEGVFSHHSTLLAHLEHELSQAVGRKIPANVDGAIAALILDLGFTWETTRIFLVAPRSVGLAAHYLEEVAQGNTWRHVPADQVNYTGPDPS